MNIYNDQDNTVSLQPIGTASESDSITILKVTSTSGKLSLKLPESVKKIEAKEINFFNEGKIESLAGSTPIETIVGQLNLKGGSKSTISNINIKNGLTADYDTKLNIENKAVFNSSSSLTLTDSSFIEFGNSVIDGICDSINLLSSFNRIRTLNSNTRTLICGESFNCYEWSNKFNGNNEFPDCRCEEVGSEKCLVAFNEKGEVGGGDGGNGGNSGKGKSKTGIIIGVIVAVVVVVAIVVVVVILLKKKKMANSSEIDNFGSGINETNNFDYDI